MSGLNSSITSINGFGITWYGKSDFRADDHICAASCSYPQNPTA